jgi:hypothetical protein
LLKVCPSVPAPQPPPIPTTFPSQQVPEPSPIRDPQNRQKKTHPPPKTKPPKTPPSFGEIAFRFPDGTAYGVAQVDSGAVVLNPRPDYVVRGGGADCRRADCRGADCCRAGCCGADCRLGGLPAGGLLSEGCSKAP